jgi:hypothetical protein
MVNLGGTEGGVLEAGVTVGTVVEVVAMVGGGCGGFMHI